MQTNHQISIQFDNVKQVKHLNNIMDKCSPAENTILGLFTGVFRKKKEVFTAEEKHFMRALKLKLKEFKV
ncbi:MAG: hypothetical protein ACPGSD_07870 [Flavobacteriales bacterium]